MALLPLPQAAQRLQVGVELRHHRQINPQLVFYTVFSNLCATVSSALPIMKPSVTSSGNQNWFPANTNLPSLQ